ncbi:MAG: YitT family protein [Proteobacteria bacterium]|nr:YitT family protein [Pseudomonadota bacterium]
MREKFKWLLQVFWNLLLISSGSVLCAAAIKGILIPKQFLAGGVTGMALLIHYALPALPVGLVYFLLNIPLFAVGWMFVGRRFFVYSIAGVVIFSLVMFWPFPVFPIHDMILNALTAGIITGIGAGMILRSLGSAGGFDILSVILFKRFSLRPGNSVLVFNAMLLLSAVFYIQLEMVLYTLIHLYVSSHFVNFVVSGLSQRKAITVVSPKWQEIADVIMNRLQRGVTIVSGEGGFSGKEIKILYAVVTFSELSRFKEAIRKIDPQAFVVVNETLEVMGKRIGNQPHW